MYKPPDFLARLRHAGEGIQVFAQALVLKPEAVSIGEGTRLDDFCRIEGGLGTRIGRYVHVASFASILGGGETEIGDFAGVAQGGRIVTGTGHPFWQEFPQPPPEDDVYFLRRGRVVLGAFAFVAANAVVLPGVTLGEGAVLAANSVATRDLPPWTISAGSPARTIRERRNFLAAAR